MSEIKKKETKSLADLIKEKQKIKEEKKSEEPIEVKPKKVKKIEVLHPPPKPPTPPKIVKEELVGDINIDYEWTAKNSTFQRFIIEFMKHHFPNQFKGVDTRTKGKIMTKQFNKKLKEVTETLDIVEEFKKSKEGDYAGVVNEFKSKVMKIRNSKIND